MGQQLSSSDLRLLKTVFEKALFQFDSYITAETFDIEHYYKDRHEQRLKRPDIVWPKNLSKKERILCKLSMLIEISKHVTSSDANDIEINDVIFKYLKRSYNECHSQGWSGVTPEDAEVMNSLHAAYVKSYSKYLHTTYDIASMDMYMIGFGMSIF